MRKILLMIIMLFIACCNGGSKNSSDGLFEYNQIGPYEISENNQFNNIWPTIIANPEEVILAYASSDPEGYSSIEGWQLDHNCKKKTTEPLNFFANEIASISALWIMFMKFPLAVNMWFA